jgi:small subunit ribosomal protein S6
MSKTTRKYEIGFIINPDATEEDVKKIIDSIVAIIKKVDGSIENIDEWGRRKLAYPIEKHHEGIYVFINTDVVGSIFSDLERRLKLSEKVMRFIVLRLDDKFKKANRLTKKWKRLEKISRKTQGTRNESPEREEPARLHKHEEREVNDEE